MGSYLAHGPKIYPRLMRTLEPSLASLAQSSWSLLSNALGGRIVSPIVLMHSRVEDYVSYCLLADRDITLSLFVFTHSRLEDCVSYQWPTDRDTTLSPIMLTQSRHHALVLCQSSVDRISTLHILVTSWESITAMLLNVIPLL